MKSLFVLSFLVLSTATAFAIPNGYTKVAEDRVADYTLVMAEAVEKSNLACKGTTFEGETFQAPLYQVVATLEAAQDVYIKDDKSDPILLFVTTHGQRRIESLITTSADRKSPVKIDLVQEDTVRTIINDGDLVDPVLREEKKVLQSATGVCEPAAPLRRY